MSVRLALLLLTLAVAPATAAPVPKVSAVPKPLPEEVVTAWTDAGATVGWAKVYPFGRLSFRTAETGEVGEMPAFSLKTWPDGVVPDLFAPDVPFAVIVFGSYLTDDLLAVLARMTNLQALSLRDTNVSDTGLVELRASKSLRSLDLGGTEVSNDGLKALAKVKSLRYLGLFDTHVTDAGLTSLAALPHLESLDLSETGVTDAGLTTVGKMTELRTLEVGWTEVTDAGLTALAALSHLESIDLTRTAVTDAGVKGLARALPDCQIDK